MSEDSKKQFKINKDWRLKLEASQNLKMEQARVAHSIQSERDEVKRKLWKDNFKNSDNERQFSKMEQARVLQSILAEQDKEKNELRKQETARIAKPVKFVKPPKVENVQTSQDIHKDIMDEIFRKIDREILENTKKQLLDPEVMKEHLRKTYNLPKQDTFIEIDTSPVLEGNHNIPLLDVNTIYTANAINFDSRNPSIGDLKNMSKLMKDKDATLSDSDAVHHPPHYLAGRIEVWDFIVDQNLDYCSGCAVKYIARAGRKNKDTHVQDLEKASAYLKRFLKYLQSTNKERYSVGKINPLDFIQDQGLTYCLGSAVDFICKFAGEVDYQSNIQEAIWFVEQEIKYVKEAQNV